MLSRQWASKGTRARVVRDHRRGFRCLFSAACPARGISVGRVCDFAYGEETSIHLADVTGRRRSKALEIPAGASLPRLPPCSPEPCSTAGVFN